MEAVRNWYRDWFNSSYYHILYNNRDERDAASFIDKLIQYLHPAPGARMLDMGCGKGRHAKQLADKGFDVTGIDLSEESIRSALEMENDHLSFYQHDMRLPFRVNYFDFVFNFFTSFGYFDTQRDNDNALRTMTHALKRSGVLVLDYLNSRYVKKHLVAHEIKVIDGVEFFMERQYADGRFLKRIVIRDISLPLKQEFIESVSAFTLADFEKMFAGQGLVITEVFGDYHFNIYKEDISPRLILTATKE